MPKDVYSKLARHLDKLPGGYPATESGVELRILKRLFTEPEAELALKCTLMPEPAKVIARRAGLGLEEARKRLDELSKKGLIFSYTFKGRTYYLASQFVIGIWEYHVKDLDVGLIRDMREYMPTLFDHEKWRKAPQLRTIPVERSISAEQAVMPYEKARELVSQHKKFLVAPCICRKEHAMTGEACDKPVETCLVFGAGVDYYEKNGLGRRISLDEVLDILKAADKAGLVLQPSNSEKIVNICCCCGCCCGVLKSFKRHPKPASLVASPFVAALSPEECKDCGVCVDRCQMDAIIPGDEAVSLDLDRCIGCGLCVSTCPTGALSLVRKPGEEQPHLAATHVENLLDLGKARGKITPLSLAMMQLKSKVERLLARA